MSTADPRARPIYERIARVLAEQQIWKELAERGEKRTDAEVADLVEARWRSCTDQGYAASHELIDEISAAHLIQDPNAVHINLLSGKIARPSVRQIFHVYGAQAIEDEIEASGLLTEKLKRLIRYTAADLSGGHESYGAEGAEKLLESFLKSEEVRRATEISRGNDQ